MRRRPYLPKEVEESIAGYIRQAVEKAVAAHESGQEDEDTLTGQLGMALKTRKRKRVPADNSVWTWEISYQKFRGRGPKATENITGADGIMEFTIDASEQQYTKSALFQAKNGRGDPRSILAQAAKLRTWEQAAFFIRYERAGYSGFGLQDAVRQVLARSREGEMPLANFLMERFVACLVGDTELRYDPESRELTWLASENRLVRTSFAVRHAIEIRVIGPKHGYRGNRISVDELNDHRMDATDEEILGLDGDLTSANVRRAKREAAKILHSDKHQQLEQGLVRLFDLWMQEKNGATERLFVRLKRKNDRQ
jgi:hypothetical protein